MKCAGEEGETPVVGVSAAGKALLKSNLGWRVGLSGVAEGRLQRRD